MSHSHRRSVELLLNASDRRDDSNSKRLANSFARKRRQVQVDTTSVRLNEEKSLSYEVVLQTKERKMNDRCCFSLSFVRSFVRMKWMRRERTNERTFVNSTDGRPLPVDGRRPLKQKKWKWHFLPFSLPLARSDVLFLSLSFSLSLCSAQSSHLIVRLVVLRCVSLLDEWLTECQRTPEWRKNWRRHGFAISHSPLNSDWRKSQSVEKKIFRRSSSRSNQRGAINMYVEKIKC